MIEPRFRAELLRFQIPVDTDEWFKFRTIGTKSYEGGVGASEVSKLLGLDQYRPSAPEMFAHKVGYAQASVVENVATEKGKLLEDLILDVWGFVRGNTVEENIEALRNYRLSLHDPLNYIPMRRHAKFGGYLVNPKYPHIFCSLDSCIPQGQPNVNAEPLDFAAPLEAKTISYWGAQSFEDRIPPKYRVQTEQQMLITESDYSELIMWEDGAVRLYVSYANKNLQQQILDRTSDFMNRVFQARRTYKLIVHETDERAREQMWAIIQRLEPDPDSSEAYKEFMKERMNGTDIIAGKAQHYRVARNYMKVREVKKVIEEQLSLHYNQLMKYMVENNCMGFDFGKEGKVTRAKSMNVALKKAIDKEEVQQVVKSIYDKL